MQDSPNNTAEFDQYAHSYTELLSDPIRSKFADDPLHFHRRKWVLIDRLLKKAGVPPTTQRWLDVGCGRGELLELCGKNFARAIGCDLSANMLPSERSFEVHKQASPVELPFEDNSVEFVTVVCVYHHVPEHERPLLTREIKRVLTPNGLCCVIEHNPWNPVTRAIVRRCPVDVDAKLLTARKTMKLFRAANFEPVATEFFLYFPERLFNRLNSVERALCRIPLGGQYVFLTRAAK